MSGMRFHTLGGSGLRVSNIALGTMTFGTERAWGSAAEDARQVFDAYVEVGGNFFDTANFYTEGTSEMLLGSFIRERGIRDRAVIASKYTYSADLGDPNAGGNQRKNLIRTIETSLKRLGTDYLDLYYVHTWDRLTPAEEVVRAMDDAVRAGKIRYVGLSNVPAWYAARVQTLAMWRGFEPICALQVEYSLIERHIELEFTDLATQLGMGLVAWSPLGMGLLTGKYRGGAAEASRGGRLRKLAKDAPPIFAKLTDRNFEIATALERVASDLERPMAQVALAWLLQKRGVGCAIVGATSAAQLRETLDAHDLRLDGHAMAALDEASEPVRHFPYYMFDDVNQAKIHGDAPVASKPETYDAPARIGWR